MSLTDIFYFFRVIYDFVISYFSTIWKEKLRFERSNLDVCVNSLLLGEGAFSVVLETTDAHNSAKKYAVKRMLLQSKECEDIAKTELISLQSFRHRSIIKMIDYMDRQENSKTALYILLPLIRRGSLRQLLNNILEGKSERMGKFQVIKDYLDICSAVEVMHNYDPSYVHQDIKPENILIGDDGRPLLTDFGSVRKARIKISSRREVAFYV